MIIDITGIELTPGNKGKDCIGNGEHLDNKGNYIECCCDECEYMMCCYVMHKSEWCRACTDNDCPRAKKHRISKK